jgi:two-component system nitrogen regulation response regulator NtrX
MDGLEVLNQVKKRHPDLPIVIISGHGNVETAVTAIKLGAYDYVEKPFKADRLLLITARALEASKLRRENKELKEKNPQSTELVGLSASMTSLNQKIEKVAPTNSRVMFTGPSGCGKELAARVMHEKSLRPTGPFVVINAAVMAPERMEEELFGIEGEGGFARKVGALEEAHGGTLFVDEVADMPMETQGKILRVLVEQKFQRLRGDRKVEVDVRIMSSTSKDLNKEMQGGNFREDLYHRLSVVPIKVPGLAERREDIPCLVDFFMNQISISSGLPVRRIGDDAMAILQTNEWPGNVRQLRNMVERVMILTDGEASAVVSADMLPDDAGNSAGFASSGNNGEHFMSLPLREAREIFEREYLMAQINRFGGNISRTAEFVGMERSALHRKLRALGVNSSERQTAKAETN